MKKRHFNKAIHMRKDYVYHEPHYTSKIFVQDTGNEVVYTCGKLTKAIKYF